MLATPSRPVRAVARRGRTEVDWLRSRRNRADLAVFHEFRAPPYGGGNQFLLALVRELEARGLAVEENRLSGGTPACLFNSFNFDFGRFRRFARAGARMVHRVDGPIAVYRGFDDGSDLRIRQINDDLADGTVFQSRWSLEKHRELGIDLREPVVIHNAVDPTIFHPPPHREPLNGRPLRVVTTSWSDNPRKGDVYLATSRDDPCSNALLEGLACGLPAAFLRRGGHPELVGEGGIGFDEAGEVPAVLERLRDEHDARRAAIRVPELAKVAGRYLEALRG